MIHCSAKARHERSQRFTLASFVMRCGTHQTTKPARTRNTAKYTGETASLDEGGAKSGAVVIQGGESGAEIRVLMEACPPHRKYRDHLRTVVPVNHDDATQLLRLVGRDRIDFSNGSRSPDSKSFCTSGCNRQLFGCGFRFCVGNSTMNSLMTAKRLVMEYHDRCFSTKMLLLSAVLRWVNCMVPQVFERST